MEADPIPKTLEEGRRHCHRRQKRANAAPCGLPNDCEQCRQFQCNRCEGVYGWGFGCADDADGLCDACWCVIVGPWLDAQARLAELVESATVE